MVIAFSDLGVMDDLSMVVLCSCFTRPAAANSITIPTIGDNGFAKANEVTVWKSVMTTGRVITSCVD